MKTFTFAEAQQDLDSVLNAAEEGCVSVTREDGQIFIIQPLGIVSSPLAVVCGDLLLSRTEIVEYIYEGRGGYE